MSPSRPATATPLKRPVKLTRSEKNDDVKRRLFAAAAKVVGRHGYADASVARITEIAGVAQGTFYNHFGNRQELLEQLLPVIGQQMVVFIRARIDEAGSEIEKEVARFRAFFDFLQETPEFLRILNEAEVFAPAATSAISTTSRRPMSACSSGRAGRARSATTATKSWR